MKLNGIKLPFYATIIVFRMVGFSVLICVRYPAVISKVFERRIDKQKLGKRSIAVLAMIIASIALSFSGLIIRNIETATPSQINIYRNLAFMVVIATVIVVRYRSQTMSQMAQITQPVIWAALGLATTGIAIVQAFTHTLVANTVFIMSSVPFITMALAYLILKETVSKIALFTIIVSAIGLVIMIGEGIGSGSTYGNMMALIAAFGFSVFAVIARAHNELEFLPALLLAAIFIVLTSIIPALDDLSVTMHDLMLCILWGAGISGLAHWVFVLAARYIAAAELTLFGLFETALAPLWVWLMIGETPGFWVLMGGLAIIASVGFKTMLDMKSGG